MFCRQDGVLWIELQLETQRSGHRLLLEQFVLWLERYDFWLERYVLWLYSI
jgi:hypothetical protein